MAITYHAGRRIQGLNSEKPIDISTTEIYNQGSGAASLDLYTAIPRVGIKAVSGNTTGHINKIKVWLRVIGTHTSTNAVYVRVRKISDDSIVATATKTIADLTSGTTVTEYEFDFGSCVEITEAEHYVLVEYAYGDASNYLGVSRHSSGVSGWEWLQYSSGAYSSGNSGQSMKGEFSSQVGHVCSSVDVQVGSRFEATDTRKMYSKLPITSLSLTGLKSYYTFNEASGTLVNSATTIGSSDSLGTASDSASTSNITYAQTGKIGDAISFNGSTSSSRVDIGSSLSQFNFLHEVNATASFNFWYKKTAVDTNFRTIWAQHYGTGGQRGVRLGFTGTRGIQFLIYNNTGSTTLGDSTSGFTANDTDWHMFTLTWDLSLATNTLQVYHDGVLDHQANRTTSGENGNSGLVPSLGDDKGGDGNWYGLLDEMSVWDRVLSANDVTLLYNSGSGTTPDNAEGGGWKEKGTT